MTLKIQHRTAILLGVSAVSLSILVPGGPIETRSFAHINPATLGIFNTFLTLLGPGSLLLIYFVWKSERWALWTSAFCGLSFLGVYGLDLAEIFPVSPDAMPPALFAIEVWGTVLAFPLMAISLQALKEISRPAIAATSPGNANTVPLNAPLARRSQVITMAGLGLVGLGIIAFATRSAMVL
ncbi:MAG: hypothetical protein AAF889_01130 [Cyanobacteria bacterium P01_D01_bin.73]